MPPNRQRECESEVGLGASNARSLVGNLVLGMSTRCQPAGAAGHNRRRLSSRGNGLYSGSHKRAQAIPLTCQQKVLGSSPITRSSKPRERGFFLRRHPPEWPSRARRRTEGPMDGLAVAATVVAEGQPRRGHAHAAHDRPGRGRGDVGDDGRCLGGVSGVGAIAEQTLPPVVQGRMPRPTGVGLRLPRR
jgi:hypothetical protein